MGVIDLIRIALRHDTLMSHAMLRACGVTREQARCIVEIPQVEYEGMMECFANRERVVTGYGS